MSVLIGSARINELGQKEGGKAGDQNKKEVCAEKWYKHAKRWYVIRAKSPQMRLKIAQNMWAACDNDYIGYSYWEHCYTLYNEAAKFKWDCSKISIPCETNCAKIVLVCAKFAGSKVKDFSTADELEKFRATGEFEIFTDEKRCGRDDFLLAGDILVTRTQGHTVVVLSNGRNAAPGVPYRTANCEYVNVRKGDSIIYGKVCPALEGGTRVDVLEWSKNGWGYVRYNDVCGYISPQYLEELQRATCKGGSAWLRDKAGQYIGKPLISIPAGSTVHITGKTTMVGLTKWYETVHDGVTGWASGKYIKA